MRVFFLRRLSLLNWSRISKGDTIKEGRAREKLWHNIDLAQCDTGPSDKLGIAESARRSRLQMLAGRNSHRPIRRECPRSSLDSEPV